MCEKKGSCPEFRNTGGIKNMHYRMLFSHIFCVLMCFYCPYSSYAQVNSIQCEQNTTYSNTETHLITNWLSSNDVERVLISAIWARNFDIPSNLLRPYFLNNLGDNETLHINDRFVSSTWQQELFLSMADLKILRGEDINKFTNFQYGDYDGLEFAREYCLYKLNGNSDDLISHCQDILSGQNKCDKVYILSHVKYMNSDAAGLIPILEEMVHDSDADISSLAHADLYLLDQNPDFHIQTLSALALESNSISSRESALFAISLCGPHPLVINTIQQLLTTGYEFYDWLLVAIFSNLGYDGLQLLTPV